MGLYKTMTAGIAGVMMMAGCGITQYESRFMWREIYFNKKSFYDVEKRVRTLESKNKELKERNKELEERIKKLEESYNSSN